MKHGGGDFALDLTGAQDGYFDPVVPWSTYHQSRIENFVPDHHNLRFGTSKECYDGKRNTKGWEGSFYRANLKAGRIMFAALKAWEEENKTTIRDILKLPEDSFARVRGEVVEKIRKNLQVL